MTASPFSRRALVLGLGLVLATVACQPRTPQISVEPTVKWASPKPLDDLTVMPQDAAAYLDKATADTLLVSPEAAKVRLGIYLERLAAPWRGGKTAYARRTAQRALTAYARNPGYDGQGRPNPGSWVEKMAVQANMRRFPNTGRPAIAVANTSLRALPTSDPRFGPPGKPGQGYPFDILQVSALWLGTPVYVDHVTKDGAWALVETAIAPGWVRMADLAYVDEGFKAQWLAKPFAALTRDNVSLGGVSAGVGAVLPMDEADQAGYALLVPQIGLGGQAQTVRARVGLDQAAPMPLAATPRNIARMANAFMGQPYGWGGLDGKRDCSAATRDVLAPFGLWLPRNSAAQARTGVFVPLAGLSPEEKEQTILRQGIPFGSLIWMSGHIMLYVGSYQGRPAVFHDIWGLRTQENGVEGRKVIGRAVVTTLRVGEIYPEVGPERIPLMRVKGLALVTPSAEPAPETEPVDEQNQSDNGS